MSVCVAVSFSRKNHNSIALAYTALTFSYASVPPSCLKISIMSKNKSSSYLWKLILFWQTFLYQCCHYFSKQNYSATSPVPGKRSPQSSGHITLKPSMIGLQPQLFLCCSSEILSKLLRLGLCSSCRPSCLEYSAFPQLHLSSKFLQKLGQVPALSEFFSCCKLSFWMFAVLTVDIIPLYFTWVSLHGLPKEKEGQS